MTFMKITLILPLLFLVGCAAGPAGDQSFLVEKTPAAAALSGQPADAGTFKDRVREANEKNDDRLLKRDWRAAKPAVGPQP
jgi:PBP1b-binding outer membrane lipoprotein LpoB